MKRNTISTMAALCLLAAGLAAPRASADDKKPVPAPLKLNIGDQAPDFKLQYFDGSNLKDVTLSQYKGKSNVVLAFYVFAFTGG